MNFHFVGSGKAMYNLAAAAVRILLLALGMARFIFALSSEVSEEGIVRKMPASADDGALYTSCALQVRLGCDDV